MRRAWNRERTFGASIKGFLYLEAIRNMKVLNEKLRYSDLCFRRMEVPATWKRD